MDAQEKILSILPKIVFPDSIYFGRNSLMYLKTIDKEKTFVLASRKAFEKNNERLNQYLSGCKIKKMSGEPKKSEIDDLYNDIKHFDTLIGVGGGSVIDLAKTAKLNREKIKLIVIPTTSGTGSEVSRYSIVIDDNGEKHPIVSEKLLPDVVLLDPSLLVSLPLFETFYTSIDALAHCLEGLVSRASNPFTDALALKSIDIIIPNLEKVIEYPNEIEIRENLQIAGLLAGLVQSSASVGLIHSFANYFGPKLSIPHGVAIGTFLIDILDTNMKNTDKYKKLNGTVYLNTNNVLERLKEVFEKAGFDYHKKRFDFSKTNIDEAAEKIRNDVCTKTNPFIPSIENIKEIIRRLQDVQDR